VETVTVLNFESLDGVHVFVTLDVLTKKKKCVDGAAELSL